ncbi:MAG: MarR family winged helix-turn-helix transcriptional regulator [Alphaproteobacteria bacterium]|jgi:DNA-binding MarR family transcriptional regulator|uniref:MarR family winged helix-turn-helix transcriptional regulator n=1 Tax=Peteryoungia algae TaxID=2919917 RepID=A0ABT0D4Q2_9HYPH|nr:MULTISPECIES: MarR family winged helix-turn-helix transcriptional regulator [unclassified Rhizobium]MBU2326534.1 MarR family winged helix-turn-helix transcriptional regulator [Alphaproteobacteria bacterium]MCC8934586.1 MarR family winged helix-turn-helix transcriptional regulator [Rhizobium sp. 'Codium 1']MCJ8240384.1 MarR family winged helix-turn-helix transcriptional regulator [Rhizobium sp. SSM4.3]
MSNGPLIPYSTTIHIKDTCLCLHAQRAARALGRRFDLALKPVGLTNQQFSLMMALNRPEPPPMGPVARLLAMDRTTLTAALKPLSARGWVSIEPDPKDRRGKRLRLTPEGSLALSDAVPIWKDVHAAIEATMTSDAHVLRQGLTEVSG